VVGAAAVYVFSTDRSSGAGGGVGDAIEARRMRSNRTSTRPRRSILHPLEENLTFMDWLVRVAMFLAIVGGAALLLVVLVLLVT